MATPLTMKAHRRSLEEPALAELLPVRDFLDDIMVRTDGSFVAGYRLGDLNTFYTDNGQRNRRNEQIEALLRSLPEKSMRLQIRCEIDQGLGDLLSRFGASNKNPSQVVAAVDRVRVQQWQERDSQGHYLQHDVKAYFIWDPETHRKMLKGGGLGRFGFGGGSLSTSLNTCITRARKEHEELLSTFNSLLSAVERSVYASGISMERMTDEELFLEVKRALNPLLIDVRPYRPVGISGNGKEKRNADLSTAAKADSPGSEKVDFRQMRPRVLSFSSAREQLSNTNIEDEGDTYLRVDGLLYSLLTIKDLPDATFPGVLRDLMVLDYPIVASAQVVVEDQTKVTKKYKSRMRKMEAAQKNKDGAYKVNIEAGVAYQELMEVLTATQASSIKSCGLSLTLITRTSVPAYTPAELEQAHQILSARIQTLIYTVARFNGAMGIKETVAKRRLFIDALPGLASDNKRDLECLTPHAADLLPLETPWAGTPDSPLMLFETPYRQLIPFSPWDPAISDANMLIMAKSGGGKTFLVQQMLLMASRTLPKISILEKGDSYQPLVELMGGRTIDVKLDGKQTLNPWDLSPGENMPSKEKIAFLKNLTLFMIGDNRDSDRNLLEGVITEAIVRTYQRIGGRTRKATPTMSDLMDELGQWRDEDGLEQIDNEARLAATKLRIWVGQRGIYSKLFDRQTSMDLDNDWVYFNLENLADDPRLATAMSIVIAHETSERFSGSDGRPAIMVLDECWFLMDSDILAPQVVQLFRTARKRGGSVWGISQTLEDFVGTASKPRPHGPGIIRNASTKIVGQQPGDVSPLGDHLHLTQTGLAEVKGFSDPKKGYGADVLISIGEKAELTHTIRVVPTPLDYWICTTYKRETVYRKWFLKQHEELPLIEAYQLLAKTFPQGLANVAELEEEQSDEVHQVD